MVHDPNIAYPFGEREESLLAFDRRVLDMVRRPGVPVLERVKFFAIAAKNLDEFFMVRVAKLRKRGKTHLLAKLYQRAAVFLKEQEQLLDTFLLPTLSGAQIELLHWPQLNEKERAFAGDYFDDLVFSSLYPAKSEPPLEIRQLKNQVTYLAIAFAKGPDRSFTIIEIPRELPAFIRLERGKIQGYLDMQELIRHRVYRLFPGRKIKDCCFFRIIRDAEIEVDEEKEDLPEAMEASLKKRPYGKIVRADLGACRDPELYEYLKSEIGLREREIFRVSGAVDYSRYDFFCQDRRVAGREKLFWQPLPQTPYAPDWFELLKKADRLLYFPYDSFQAVTGLLAQAAEDEQVLAIKQTIYRVGKDSPVIDQLIKAAECGKQVMVVMELRAKFDEGQNVRIARKLSKAGCTVVYGRTQKKVHAKLLLITRKERGQMIRYAHVGTGNYNEQTSRLYTDAGLMTSDKQSCEQISRLFRYLAGEREMKACRSDILLVSPANIRSALLEKINWLSQQAQKGQPAHLVMKVNALTDEKVIRALYQAKGVRIDLIVRGICTLVPGVKGVSEHIRVVSIVGRFLEHSRIWYFSCADKQECYLGSADLMPKNLDKRVETMIKIADPQIREKLAHILNLYLHDTQNASELDQRMRYHPLSQRTPAYDVHEALKELADPFTAGRGEKGQVNPADSKDRGGSPRALPLPAKAGSSPIEPLAARKESRERVQTLPGTDYGGIPRQREKGADTGLFTFLQDTSQSSSGETIWQNSADPPKHC